MPKQITTPVMFWLVLGFVVAGAQNRDLQPSPIRRVEGASIFQDFCAPCHGRDGEGKDLCRGT